MTPFQLSFRLFIVSIAEIFRNIFRLVEKIRHKRQIELLIHSTKPWQRIYEYILTRYQQFPLSNHRFSGTGELERRCARVQCIAGLRYLLLLNGHTLHQRFDLRFDASALQFNVAIVGVDVLSVIGIVAALVGLALMQDTPNRRIGRLWLLTPIEAHRVRQCDHIIIFRGGQLGLDRAAVIVGIVVRHRLLVDGLLALVVFGPFLEAKTVRWDRTAFHLSIWSRMNGMYEYTHSRSYIKIHLRGDDRRHRRPMPRPNNRPYRRPRRQISPWNYPDTQSSSVGQHSKRHGRNFHSNYCSHRRHYPRSPCSCIKKTILFDGLWTSSHKMWTEMVSGSHIGLIADWLLIYPIFQLTRFNKFCTALRQIMV